LVAAVLFSGSLQGGAPSADSVKPAPAEEPTLRAPTDFTGQWTYNEAESINGASGRPETARAADQRRGIGSGAAP
jgi:hypothetical protein